MKKIFSIIVLFVLALILVGCEKATNVNGNLRRKEGNFEIYRQVTVINLRSDKILMEIEGYLNISIDTDGDLNITIMTGPATYKLHYASLGEGVVYISQQVENTHTSPYHWEIRIFAITPDIEWGRN